MDNGLCTGSSLSGILPEIHIDKFERNLFDAKQNFVIRFIFQWYRYCNDIFVLWSGNKALLHSLHNLMDSISKLTFNLEFKNNNSINFLDLTITRNLKSNQFSYYIFRKPNTTDCVIPFDSFIAPITTI